MIYIPSSLFFATCLVDYHQDTSITYNCTLLQDVQSHIFCEDVPTFLFCEFVSNEPIPFQLTLLLIHLIKSVISPIEVSPEDVSSYIFVMPSYKFHENMFPTILLWSPYEPLWKVFSMIPLWHPLRSFSWCFQWFLCDTTLKASLEGVSSDSFMTPLSKLLWKVFPMIPL